MSARRKWLIATLVLLVPALVAVALLRGQSDDSGAPASRTQPVGAAGGEVELSGFTLAGEAVDEELAVNVLEPRAAAPGEPPLLVFLHGAGGSEESFVAEPAVLDGLRRLGARAPVVAFPEGRLSWWHDREDGEWGRYVVREVIPAVSRRYGTDPRRVAIGGISMGGFGAYHLGLEHPRRFCAVGGHSAGLWTDPADEYPGAFDGPADHERNDVIAAVERDPDGFGAARVWNDYGDEDWFVPGNEAFVAALERGDADLTARVWPGGHDISYWNAHWHRYLDFYADSLARCGKPRHGPEMLK